MDIDDKCNKIPITTRFLQAHKQDYVFNNVQ